jgi:hypothetical protein
MDSEVSALMGVTNEELWEKKGILSLVDEMCRFNVSSCHLNVSLNVPSVISLDMMTPPLAGKKCSSQPYSATFLSQGHYHVGLGNKEGASFARKNSGLGFNSSVEGYKFPKFSKNPSTQLEASLGGHNISQGGFLKMSCERMEAEEN